MSRLSMSHRGPVIIDLVDGYLSYKPSFLEDFSRNLTRSTLGRSSFRSVTFTNELRRAISAADAVVVSCPEQAENIEEYNKNVHCILDDHSELLTNSSRGKVHPKNFVVIWEGLGYTLQHLIAIADDLERFVLSREAQILVVSNESFYRYSSRFGRAETKQVLRNVFKKSWKQFEFIEWSIPNLLDAAARANVGIIPIKLQDRFANAKPENKLLSFWSLGLPVLCSPTPAYTRVLTTVDQKHFLVPQSEWSIALNRFHSQLYANPSGFDRDVAESRSYLGQYHTREILVQKWDKVLRPLL